MANSQNDFSVTLHEQVANKSRPDLFILVSNKFWDEDNLSLNRIFFPNIKNIYKEPNELRKSFFLSYPMNIRNI